MSGAGGSDGRCPLGGGLSQCGVRSPVGVSRAPSKARAATAALGSRSRRLTDAVPAWFSRGCSAFSSAITPFLETSSPASLPVPPAPARGRSASPTTRRTGFRLRGGAGVPGVGPAAQCEACSLPRSHPASNTGHPLPSPPLTWGHPLPSLPLTRVTCSRPASNAGSPERSLAGEEMACDLPSA